MRSPEPDQAVTSRWKWTIDIRATVQFAATCVIVVAIIAVAALLHRSSPEATTRPIVKGSIRDTRIVIDHAVETAWGGQPQLEGGI